METQEGSQVLSPQGRPTPFQVFVVADPDEDDPGWVGQLLAERGGRLRTLYRGADDLAADLSGTSMVMALGSAGAVYDPARSDVVEAEARLVRRAGSAGVPVLGICYGAQLAAYAHGGTVRPLARGEVGWFELESRDDVLCPPGPWLQFHSDVLDPPPGAQVLGTSPAGTQAFALEAAPGRPGPVLGWQFHPETTPATLQRWVRTEADSLARHGADADELVAETVAREQQSRTAAARLVDGALTYLGVPAGDPG